MTGAAGATVSVALLAVVLVVAVWRPRALPEATAAVPAAAVVVALGLLSPTEAWAEVVRLGPTVGFLAAVLVLAHLADAEGVFAWAGALLATRSRGAPVRLLGWVFAVAAVVTAVLSLDATVVLLTPVVLRTARRLGVRPEPAAFVCLHLANSASLLLPVSNLTNLLAVSATGLTFTGFAALMALPWLAVLLVEYAGLRWVFRRELRGAAPGPGARGGPARGDGVRTDPGLAGAEPELAGPGPGPASAEPGLAGAGPGLAGGAVGGRRPDLDAEEVPLPRFAVTVLALTLAGFAVASPLGVEPVWVAVVGAVVLGARSLLRRRTGVRRLVAAASPLFCLFVLALGVVVAAVGTHGLGGLLARLLPDGQSLPALLAVAAIAAVLANVVNNLPATLLLLAAFGPSAPVGAVLAMLIGVGVGPNLTWIGSLATLLWRRVLVADGTPARLRDLTVAGLVTVPAGLVVGVVALWSVL